MDTGLSKPPYEATVSILSQPPSPVATRSQSRRRISRSTTQEGLQYEPGPLFPEYPHATGRRSESVTVTADAIQCTNHSSEIGATVSPPLVAQFAVAKFPENNSQSRAIHRTLPDSWAVWAKTVQAGNSSDDFKVNGGQEGAPILVDGGSISLVSPKTQWNKCVSTDAGDELPRDCQSNFRRIRPSRDGIGTDDQVRPPTTLPGSGYDFLRNKSRDANKMGQHPPGNKKVNDTQNDFGAMSAVRAASTVYNGKKKKTFFSLPTRGSCQEWRTGQDSFPNENFAKGEFSQICHQALRKRYL